MRKIENGDIVRYNGTDLGEVVTVYSPYGDKIEVSVTFDNSKTTKLLLMNDLKLVAKKSDRKDTFV